MQFELDNLDAYDRASILVEIKRVSTLVKDRPLTRNVFDQKSKVASSTVVRRFGSWAQARAAAGLADRYSGRTVSQRMRTQEARCLSKEQMVAELRRVAMLSPGGGITRAMVDQHAVCNSAAIER